jgi:hypothetical protein
MYKQDIALMNGGRLRYVDFTITYKDLQATSGAGAQSINLTDADNSGVKWVMGQSSKILGVEVKHDTSFSGGSLSAMTVSLGVSGAVTRYTAAFDVFQAVADTALQETAMFKSVQRSAQQLEATFTPTGDVCSNATAGQVQIRICMLDVSTPGI